MLSTVDIKIVCLTILSVGKLIAQILVLANIWQTSRLLKNKKGNEVEKENTHPETPKWVEEFVDEYMANTKI